MKITRDQAAVIYLRWRARPTYKSLAAEFGVTEKLIQKAIARGRTIQDVKTCVGVR